VSHTYASVADFNSYRVDQGDSLLGNTGEAAILTFLEGASRSVDAFCDRSRFGSGFGPRTGANSYDDPGVSVLRLDDDLLAITSVTTTDTIGGGTTTLTETTDFLARRSHGIYTTPSRELAIHGDSSAWWGAADKGNVVTGTWGYSNETVSLGTMGTATGSATSLTLTAGSASAGMTLLNEAEQMYVTAGGTAITVVRGVNGTTAAVHAASTSVSRYVYPEEIVTAAVMIAHRRWRSQQAGLTGDFGSVVMPTTAHRDTERAILRNVVGHLKVYG
jgi:hypothetical protein